VLRVHISLSCFHNLLLSYSDDEEPPARAAPAPSASPAATDEPAEPAAAMRTTRAAVKKVSQTQAQNRKRAKRAKETGVSLEAHASVVPSDDVSDSIFLLICFLSLLFFSDILFL
jgi:hypothetical protein